MRSSGPVSLLAAVALAAVGLGTVSGCGSQQEAKSGSRQETSGDASELAHRAREVAAAWDGSVAAAEWRSGYHPMGDVVQLPQGGLRGRADREAYQDRSVVLRSEVPATGPKDGPVAWDGGESATRPLVSAQESYKTLAGTRTRGKPHLTVTGAKLGEMSVTTSRGPATVPAWLFSLEGYDSPLRQAAVNPSKLPRPPIKRARDVPGNPLDQLIRISADGHSVTVIATHGACDDGPAVAPQESHGSVVLSASVKNPKTEGFCTKQGKLQQVTVKLNQPVGDRILLDALTGKPIPYKPPHGPSPSWT
ncbi:hypothetical protein LHJ74_06880 [Streptomyces sp. N2-109]|uniref:Lipoprotein n=1 Tax=Streptomyces gossypii TaxID=2883101 RepID=A0ABT2JP39_9ACTN|nr:hypothetical protein [Streptomyces gossypii]MCT2589648.1 hypothetical protein [Streptomyces gossypii]